MRDFSTTGAWLRWYAIQNGRALSRLLNSLTGGEGDTTFSAYSYQLVMLNRPSGPLRVRVVDWLNQEPGHCRMAWEWHHAHRLFEDDQAGVY